MESSAAPLRMSGRFTRWRLKAITLLIENLKVPYFGDKRYMFLEEKEILTVDRKHLLYSINLKVMLTEELKRYKKKLVES